MKPPPLFLGLLLLFWGLQTGTLWLGTAAAIGLEYARMLKNGFDLKTSDFNTLLDISTLFLAGTLIIGFVVDAPQAIFILLKWLPLICYPVILAQECSDAGRIETRAFFLTSRKQKTVINPKSNKSFDVGYIYAVLVLISAGSVKGSGLYYSVAVALFSSWALFHSRPRRYGLALWFCCLVAALAGSYGSQRLMETGSDEITRFMMEYYERYYGVDQLKSSTSLGEIGRLKLSGNIVARVMIDEHPPGKPYLLQDGVYTTFNSLQWFALNSPFTPVSPKNRSTYWQINPSPGTPLKRMTVYLKPPGKKAALLLPAGVVSIAEMKAGGCEKNRMQAVRIENAPGLVKNRIAYTGRSDFAPGPSERDLKIPEQERGVIKAIADEVLPASATVQETITGLQDYFAKNFSYSLTLHGKGKFPTPLANFLKHTRSGHCELFSTATVLLLRQAGIPARYATGFIAHEYSPLTDRLVVRHRDAHAWVKVLVDGQWHDLDTTPPSFLQTDAARVKPSPLGDFLSFLGFELSRIRHESGARFLREYGLRLLIPMFIYLGFRLRKSSHVRWVRAPQKEAKETVKEGLEADIQLLEQALAGQGFRRNRSEPVRHWLERTACAFDDSTLTSRLHDVGSLHSRFRYSEGGLSPMEQSALRF